MCTSTIGLEVYYVYIAASPQKGAEEQVDGLAGCQTTSIKLVKAKMNHQLAVKNITLPNKYLAQVFLPSDTYHRARGPRGRGGGGGGRDR